MPLSLSLFNNEVRATKGDYSTLIVPLSSDLDSSTNFAILSSKSFTQSNYYPLSGGTVFGNVTVTGNISGGTNQSIALQDGLSLAPKSLAIGTGIAAGTNAFVFGNGTFGGTNSFVGGYQSIAAAQIPLSGNVFYINKISNNIWSIPQAFPRPSGQLVDYYFYYIDWYTVIGQPGTSVFQFVSTDVVSQNIIARFIRNLYGNDASGYNALLINKMYVSEIPGLNSSPLAIGYQNIASAENTLALGYITQALGNRSVALGSNTIARGEQAFATGNFTAASGLNSVAFGFKTNSYNDQSFVGGSDSISSGLNSFSFGLSCKSLGDQSVTLGRNCLALGLESLALGRNNRATGNYSSTLGYQASASGLYSHSDGIFSVSQGDASYSYGWNSNAKHDNTWVWNSNPLKSTSTSRDGQFLVNASGGISLSGNVGVNTDNNTRALTVSGDAYVDNAYVNSFSAGVITGDTYRETSNTYITITNTGSMNIDPAWDGKVVLVNNSSNLDISLLAFQRVGFSVTFVSLTPNTVSFSAGVGATLNSDSNKNKISAQFCSAVITCYTSNTYLLIGNISN